MPRKPTPKFHPARKAYYCQVGGVKHTLQPAEFDDAPNGPNYRAAVARFAEIVAGSTATARGDNGQLVYLLDKYLQWCRANRRAATYEIRRRALQSFCDRYGGLTYADLRLADVEEWLAESANTSTRQMRAYSILAAFNWLAKHEVITKNKLSGKLELPRANSRAADSLISDAQHAELIAACKGRSIVRLLEFLKATGCRPSEACMLCPEWIRGDLAVIPAPLTKSKRRDRIIFIPPGTAEWIPFVRKNGRPWRKNDVRQAVYYYRRKTSLPATISAYSYRHTYCTNFLLAGGHVAILSQLVGTSITMLERHYSHLADCTAALAPS